jgi:4-diphosphocytidyl-2-C-methyl-D-erythritol kinase
VILTAFAPGKTNLCLFLGGTRADGLHELVSVIEPLSLTDELSLEPLPGGAPIAATVGAGDMGCAAGEDEVVCPGVDGPNLAGEALAAFRAASGWEGPPLRLTIVKRVPVAAGMGGGSGDAAAALRLIAHAAGRDAADPLLAQLAARLGADVPSQVAPRPVLVGGAGEHVQPLPLLPPHGVLVLPSPHALATPDVFREADRLGLGRSSEELAARRAQVLAVLAPAAAGEPLPPDPARAAAGGPLPPELLVNDLEPAARSLCPSIDDALAAARATGADHALVSGCTTAFPARPAPARSTPRSRRSVGCGTMTTAHESRRGHSARRDLRRPRWPWRLRQPCARAGRRFLPAHVGARRRRSVVAVGARRLRGRRRARGRARHLRVAAPLLMLRLG